jgi:radical SAM protein with 4Fe4S-binding SPASM domain
MMNPRIDCSQSPLAVRLQPQEVVALDLQDDKRVAAWQQFAAQFNGPVNPPERSQEVYHCGGGVSSFAISPGGKMSICVLSHAATYDVRQGSFRQGWEHFLAQQRRKKISRLTKCTTCAIKAMCGMCPANGELENGDPESPVEFLCHVAHLRAYALEIPVPLHGACAYCPGGAHYPETLQEAATLSQTAGAITNRVRSANVLFPIVYEEPKCVA